MPKSHLPKREDKMHKTERRLESNVFDRPTLFAIAKLQRMGLFETVDYPVAKGKEANIFCGTTKEGGKVAIKIYRIDTSNFIRMHEYIEGDPRFANTRRARFETIVTWTRKEYSNLRAFYAARISVPRPLGFLRNIVVMEFLGEGNIAYSTLDQMGSEQPQKDFDFLLSEVKRIYQLGFVHADVSEYNIVVTDDGLRLLDCAQAVLLAHPRADDFLRRDVGNLVRFFKKQGAKCDIESALLSVKDGKPVLRGLEALKYESERAGGKA